MKAGELAQVFMEGREASVINYSHESYRFLRWRALGSYWLRAAQRRTLTLSPSNKT